MLQRIQTLFIFLGIVSVILYLIFIPDYIDNLKVDIFSFISTSVGIVAVFLYNNRERQAVLCKFNAYFNIAPVLYLLLLCQTDVINLVSFHLLMISTISYIFAYKFIQKDINLIKSSDRLR